MSRIEKYLAQYAEEEARRLPAGLPYYENSLVIPAHAESAEQLQQVWRQLDHTANLVIILIANASTADSSTANMAREICSSRDRTQLSENVTLLTRSGSPDIILVDRFSAGWEIPIKQGVGLARKIGVDIALAMHHAGRVASRWLRTTDADASLPPDYLQEFDTDAVACLYPFEHIPEPEDSPHKATLALMLYEIYMLYTVLALREAGSPYAYPTIGSIISCQSEAYAAVRGFPRRASAEDFYLLNKLRKIGAIDIATTGPVRISGRASSRVPVGTGRAVTRIAGFDDPLTQYTFEHPVCYEKLASLLEYFDALAARQPEAMEHPDPAVQAYAESSGLAAHYAAQHSKRLSAPVLRKSMNDWFDGLRTRQFVRLMVEKHAGRLTLAELSDTRLLQCTGADTPQILAMLRRRVFEHDDSENIISTPDLTQGEYT